MENDELLMNDVYEAGRRNGKSEADRTSTESFFDKKPAGNTIDTLCGMVNVKMMLVGDRPKMAFFMARQGFGKDDTEVVSYADMAALSPRVLNLVRAEWQLGIRCNVFWKSAGTWRVINKTAWVDGSWECNATVSDGPSVSVVLHREYDAGTGPRYTLTLVDPTNNADILAPGTKINIWDDNGSLVATSVVLL